jgi:predicted  nucleic acid-binding Zn-ribbon protein
MDLKRKLLALLKEDEEFRYAVIGLLGIEDLRSGQVRLENGLAKLEEAQARLQGAIEKLVESHNKLAERQGALEKAVEMLIKRQDALEKAIERLTESHNKLAERQCSLEKAVERLMKRQDALEGAFQKLVERHDSLERAVQKLTERHDSLELAFQKLVEAQARTEEALQELSRQVGRLSDTIGFGLEDIARVVVPGWLYRHEGIELESLTRKFIKVDGEELEINLYGEGSKGGVKITILGEARSRIYSSDVENFDRLVEKVKRFVPNNVYKLMFGYYVHPSAEQEAKKRGITLIASYMR